MSLDSERRRLRERLDHPDKLRLTHKLPVDSFREAVPWLRRPFAPEAVRFRVVEAWGDDDKDLSHALVAPYIDARTAQARLNMVIPGMWSAEFKTAGPSTWCGLTAQIRDGAPEALRVSDVGEGGTDKARRSDALKRAAVSFGVGESLYAVPPMQFGPDMIGSLRPWMLDGAPWLRLTRVGEEHARNIYRRWLLKYGIPAFGNPLDHGDLTAESETLITGPPRPRASQQAAPQQSRRRPPSRASRSEQTVGEPAKSEPVELDPEATAQAELDVLLSATDGLADERRALSAMMLAHFGASAVKRLDEIRAAETDREGPKAGLQRALDALGSISKVKTVPMETESEGEPK